MRESIYLIKHHLLKEAVKYAPQTQHNNSDHRNNIIITILAKQTETTIEENNTI